MILTLAAWWGKQRVMENTARILPRESWEHVQEKFPIPPAPAELSKLTSETLQAVVQTNPFSPLRKTVIPQPVIQQPQGVQLQSVAPPAKARWIYKGRIEFSKKQRAVMENAATGKTHFLEVGQEVAGFKLLDIAENQVLLSDVEKNEEVVVPLQTTLAQ